MKCKFIFILVCLIIPISASSQGLTWPVNCIPGQTCTQDLGLPDVNSTGISYDCSVTRIFGHSGTDINAIKGTDIYAAASGTVIASFDGDFDDCPSNHPDCQQPIPNTFAANFSGGYRNCTALGPYCPGKFNQCFWCSDGGNTVIIQHPQNSKVFATEYDHFKKNSILVQQGDTVTQGQKIGEVGSSGKSTGPHLHFHTFGKGFHELVDPWAGPCGPNFDSSLWENAETPWASLLNSIFKAILPPFSLLLDDDD